jgi:hypothetical protein
MIALLLYCLAILDSAFIGFRSAMGQRGEIDKRGWLLRACLHGAFMGHICVAISGLAVLLVTFTNSDPQRVWGLLNHCALHMLYIFSPYAGLILIGLVFRSSIPILDVRCAFNLVLFGPFTVLRPIVVAAGLIYGASVTPGWQVAVIAVLVAILMLGLEPTLIRYYRKQFWDPNLVSNDS